MFKICSFTGIELLIKGKRRIHTIWGYAVPVYSYIGNGMVDRKLVALFCPLKGLDHPKEIGFQKIIDRGH
jgi:hypothetical protein